MAFDPPAGPSYNVINYDFDKDPPRLAYAASITNVRPGITGLGLSVRRRLGKWPLGVSFRMRSTGLLLNCWAGLGQPSFCAVFLPGEYHSWADDADGRAFGRVESALNFFITRYQSLASYKAVAEHD